MTSPLHASCVSVAGVPWPRHKLFAVIAGFVTLLLLGVLTTSAALSVLGGAGVAIVVGLVLKRLTRPHS
jgi:O-antigen ligase